MRITQVIRSLQDRVVELLVQLEVCVRVGMRVICVLCYQRGRGGRLRARAPKGMHWRCTLRPWKNILKMCVIHRNTIERLKQLRGSFMCVTSNGDSVAETTGLRIEVECCQTGNFMLVTGNAPPQAILVQRTASTSSPSPSSRCSSCSTCF